jgi:glycosyltransferase involved in cell wall biosynthesis
MPAASIGMAMIVKNEALTLPRLAASVRDQLDHWIIVDTGSDDETVTVAEKVFSGVPGNVIRDVWRGYGPSRNVALEAARPHTDLVLTIDADDTLHGTLERSIPANADGIEAEYHVGPLRYWVPRLVRSSAPWEWRSRAHEYLTLPSGPGSLHRSSSFYVTHHADGGNRATKFERELALLKLDLRETPGEPRTLFYLARTYEDGLQPREAARWYRRRIETPGWEEETWYALWRLGICVLAYGTADEATGILWRAWGRRPWRAEPLWTLAEHYRLTSQWHLNFEACELARRYCSIAVPGYPGASDSTKSALSNREDRLFIHNDVYDWRIDYEQSISAYYVGQTDLGKRLTLALLARRDLPKYLRDNLRSNLLFYGR